MWPIEKTSNLMKVSTSILKDRGRDCFISESQDLFLGLFNFQKVHRGDSLMCTSMLVVVQRGVGNMRVFCSALCEICPAQYEPNPVLIEGYVCTADVCQHSPAGQGWEKVCDPCAGRSP